MQKTQKAFTLVELIVVITILAILGTIAFISLQGYSKKARDSKRTADIANIKVSLELFSLNTGYYPLPDNGEEVLYDNDLLWTQGIVGDNVTTNLSRNLLKKPTDPLHDIEYIYSLASSKKEYEVMSVHEGDLATNNLMNSTYASDKYSVKVEGNYNELFIKTSRHIFPVPSLITSAPLPLDFDLVPSAIESQVITGGDNFPNLNIPNIETSTGALKMTLSVYSGSINKDSIDDIKKAVVEKIQLAYSGSDIETSGVYKTLLAKTTDEELLNFIDDVVLNNSSSSVVKDIDAPTGGSFSMDTETSSVNITLTIICPEENGVEMYIDGDVVGTSEWESCTSSKNIELASGGGSKSVGVKWRDSEGNESNEISKSIEYLIYYNSCQDAYNQGQRLDGNYNINKNSGGYFNTLCDFDELLGIGWTLVLWNDGVSDGSWQNTTSEYQSSVNIFGQYDVVGRWKLSDSDINILKTGRIRAKSISCNGGINSPWRFGSSNYYSNSSYPGTYGNYDLNTGNSGGCGDSRSYGFGDCGHTVCTNFNAYTYGCSHDGGQKGNVKVEMWIK